MGIRSFESHVRPPRLLLSILYVSPLSCNELANPRYPRKNGTISKAGRYIHQYDTRTLNCCRLERRFPQLGTGSGTPSPRNESVISTNTYCGTRIAACVKRTLDVSGRM